MRQVWSKTDAEAEFLRGRTGERINVEEKIREDKREKSIATLMWSQIPDILSSSCFCHSRMQWEEGIMIKFGFECWMPGVRQQGFFFFHLLVNRQSQSQKTMFTQCSYPSAFRKTTAGKDTPSQVLIAPIELYQVAHSVPWIRMSGFRIKLFLDSIH